MQSAQVFLKIEKIGENLKLWIANLKQLQGIIEFETTPLQPNQSMKQVTIEMMIKDQLLSDIKDIQGKLIANPQISIPVEKKSELIIKMIHSA